MPSSTAWSSMATAAEESGFDSVWVMDHFYQLPPLGGPSQPMLEAYTLLGALAARTTRVRLGAMVTGVTYRNPAHLAKIVTTLDVISAGRAILGIGAAWYDVEHEGLGFDFPPAGERLDRLEEALQICRAMFREEAPTFEGRYYRIHEARNVPRPVQPGGPPILVGGGGEKRTLRLVARYADMCNIFGDAATIAHKVDVLRGHCEAVGRDPARSDGQPAEHARPHGERRGDGSDEGVPAPGDGRGTDGIRRRARPTNWSHTSRSWLRRGRVLRLQHADRARPRRCAEVGDAVVGALSG